jgi:pSer/pThr/pTyr-binding forkhead associated (FHA) protein
MSFLEVAGQRLAVPVGDASIGSDPGSHFALTGPGIAPQHAVLHGFPDGQASIRKVADHLEVAVNGVRLGPQPTPLLHGDKVEIGMHEMLFVDERRSGSTQMVQAINPASLAAAAGKPKAAGAATAATGGRLVCLTDGREYTITGSLVIGRDAVCDVVVTSKDVSRRHAEVMASPKGYVIVDSSTNGTFVNGQQIEGQVLLARADVIRVGTDEFRFYADAAPKPAAAPAAHPVPPAGAQHKLADTSAHQVGTGIPHSPRTGEDAAVDVSHPPAQHAPPPPPAPPPPAPPRQAAPPPPPAARPPAASPPTPPVAPRPSPATTQPATRSSGPAALAYLVIRSGVLKGQRLPIKVPVVNVGRADYNDLMIPDDSVSTQHAKIQRREGLWIMVDLGSTNGTLIDGERVTTEVPLSPGSYIRFGDVQVVFEPADDDVAASKGGGTRMMGAIKMPPKP